LDLTVLLEVKPGQKHKKAGNPWSSNDFTTLDPSEFTEKEAQISNIFSIVRPHLDNSIFNFISFSF